MSNNTSTKELSRGQKAARTRASNKAAKAMSRTVSSATLKGNGTKPANMQGGKKGANNIQQRKLTEARDVLAGRYNKLAHRDSEGKATKVTFAWVDVFDQANGDAQTAHDELTKAKEVYASESQSISQLFLEIARKAGTLEQFRTDYKNMCFVWKTTNNIKAVPQSVLDAASIIKRAYKANIDVKKATSIHTLKEGLKQFNKDSKEETVATPDINPAISNTMSLLTKLALQLEADNMLDDLSQLLSMLGDVSSQFIDEGNVTVPHEADLLDALIEQDNDDQDELPIAASH